MDSSTLIEGVILTKLPQINDERGAVLHMIRSDAKEFTKFGECYFSEIMPGAIKAWKCHHLQTQNFAVPVGKIRLVIYDKRNESKSFGKLSIIDLGRPDDYFRVQIPPGLWYGFQCLNQAPALLTNCSDILHDPNESEVLPMDSDEIPYRWLNNPNND
jgi:dTDP-4-dehydrorhamnose 3,5-epimerase